MALNKTAMVTGVLGGIGSAMALEFKNQGYKVIGLDVKASENSGCDVFYQFDLNK